MTDRESAALPLNTLLLLAFAVYRYSGAHSGHDAGRIMPATVRAITCNEGVSGLVQVIAHGCRGTLSDDAQVTDRALRVP
jgi:hypothetical protein